MYFYYENKTESIRINVNVTESALNDLIDGGFLDENFDIDGYFNDELDEFTAENQISDAVVDWIADEIEKKEADGTDLEFLDESNDILKAVYIIDENKYFCQFLDWRYNDEFYKNLRKQKAQNCGSF